MCRLNLLLLIDLTISKGEESLRFLIAIRNHARHDPLRRAAIWCRRFDQKS